MVFAIAEFGLGPIAGTVAQAAITFGLAFGALKIGLAAGKGNGIMGGAFSGSLKGLQKFRSNRASHNIHGVKTGERFSGSRFIPGSTRAAEVANKAGFSIANGAIPFTGKTRAALGHAQTTEAKKMLDTFKEKDIDQHDDALRYGSYLNDRQGWRAVRDRYMPDPNDTTISAAERAQRTHEAEQRANSAQDAWRATKIKKTGASAQAAAMQLGRTGTGYRDLRDQVETIARVSGGNDTVTADLAGDLNATSKEKRPDLTPGNGELTGMAMAVSHRGAGAVTGAEYDRMTAHAMRNSGSVGALVSTGKGQAFDAIDASERQQAQAMHHRQVMNAGGPNAAASETWLRGYYGADVRGHDAASTARAQEFERAENNTAADFSYIAEETAGTNYSFGSAGNLGTMTEMNIRRNGAPPQYVATARGDQDAANALYRNDQASRRFTGQTQQPGGTGGP